jgi:hypothetical protein
VAPPPAETKQEDSKKLPESFQEATAPSPAAIAAIPTKLQPQPGKKREVQLSRTYRLPERIVSRLEAVCDYNNVGYTEFVAEAIDRHLDSFPQPPEK